MKFNYQVRTQQGQAQTGVVEASSKEAALSVLQKHGLFVTYLEEAKAPLFARRVEFLQRISRKDMVMFSRQLAILFKSNVPVVEALNTLSEQTKNPKLRESIEKITENVEGGTPLSQSLDDFPEIFSPFYISTVKSGEASGKLADVLNYLADHLEREYNFYSKIIGAMIYPAFVLFVFVIILILMMIFVVPALFQVLGETGQELPAITKITVALSNVLLKWWWILLILLFASIFSLIKFVKSKTGKKTIDGVAIKLPIFGEFFKKIYLTRLAENLSTLVSSGLPIVQALEICGEIVGNDVYRTLIFKTRDGVRKGEPISGILIKHPEVFPPLFVQMVVVGERTGHLDTALTNVVSFYQKDVEHTLDSFISFLEPLLIIGLGLVMVWAVIAFLLPIWQIGAGGM